MKKFFVIALAAAAMLFAGCEKDSGEDGPDAVANPVKSYEFVAMMNGNPHFKGVYTPSYDSKGRLTGIKYEHYEQDWSSEDAGLYLAEKRSSTVTYDESAKTAVSAGTSQYYNREEKKWSDPDSEETKLTFDDNWRVVKTESKSGESQYSEVYAYRGDNVASYTYTSVYDGRPSETVTNYTWNNGDLVEIKDSYSKTTVNYGSEANPFLGTIDLTLDSMPEFYSLGILGKTSAHLPTSYTHISGTGENEWKYTYNIEYTKDSKGRITEIIQRYALDGDEPNHEEEHYTKYVINY